jgi:hypothetical protein
MLRSLWVSLALLAAAACGDRPEGSGRDGAPAAEGAGPEDRQEEPSGRSLLGGLDVFRDRTGALRARGRLELPDGTRMQLTVYRPEGGPPLARTQFALQAGRFESPPLTGPDGPLPEALYRFHLVTYFDPAWQPREVMEATDEGRALKGPGVTRGHRGRVAFLHQEDLRR